MPKNTQANDEVSAEVTAKVKRVRRYAENGDQSGVIFTLPSGAKREVAYSDFHVDSTKRALLYGAGQLFQDSLARGKDEVPATDEEANESIDRFASGNWAATRGGPTITMQSVAATLFRKAFKDKHGKAPTADEVKEGVPKLLDAEGNPKGFGVVKGEYDRLMAVTVEI